MNKRLIPILMLWLVAAVALSGCGEGGDSSTPPVFVTATPHPDTIAQLTTVAPTDQRTAQPPSQPTTAPTVIAQAPPSPTTTPTATLPPGSFGPVVSGDAPIPPVSTSASPPAPAPTSAPGIPFGPIIGPDYTLEPTETRVAPTPLPTGAPTAGPSPTAPASALRRDYLGVQIHPHIDSSEFEQVMFYAQDLGVTWVKYQFNWSLLESGPGHYTDLFHILRVYVQKSHDRGFKVLISVAKAPGWSRTPGPDGQLRENGPPDDPQVLAKFLSGMLQQIGTDANGQPVVDAVEVWNEPNLQREWTGHPMTGEDYMRYFRPAYDAIRAFSPQILVITAAPAPTGDSQWSTDDRAWFKGMYNAGLASYGPDVAVGIHPYGWGNAPDVRCCPNPAKGWDDAPQFFFLDTIEDYRAIMVANGHTSAQLWTTEFGWATFDGLQTSYGDQPSDPQGQEFYSFITQVEQAQYTVRALYLAQDRDYMGPMILWNLNFATIPGAVDQSNPQTGYGLLDRTWQPRPVYQALKSAPKQ